MRLDQHANDGADVIGLSHVVGEAIGSGEAAPRAPMNDYQALA
jgi:hypothetical protein